MTRSAMRRRAAVGFIGLIVLAAALLTPGEQILVAMAGGFLIAWGFTPWVDAGVDRLKARNARILREREERRG